MTRATKSASRTSGTRKKTKDDQAQPASAALEQTAPEQGAPGVPAQGDAKADAAHLDTVNNQLVDHGYLTEEEFQTISETLQRNLATTISLYLKFKKYHWDIRGRFFRDLHLAYDEFIEEIFPTIDEQAERLVALGGSPIAAPADIERFSVVQVPTETVRDARTQVKDLVADLTRVGKGYRDDSQTVDEANDPATADMYNGYAATIDKIRWMLQAILDDDRMN
ncbi:Ferritin and Dps [Deinococcus geothermalis DSM 11300]|uniref:Ferritin and Dps n=1 Tax=Deinococcus geothermalis (strain DSM 11300 / CIP 105573 / AG-3a) TaxID=319795 RepID=Q1J1Q0_DEIGD|nr:Dps family protein [Deinococcus geothermalis]ABF44584.1 Ferritin and Dps [Deinococcus geothermalis DSM 11300]